MSSYREVNIPKESLRVAIYFILMKFRSDPLHHQGTSSKRDLIGGYIERWFNRVAETLILDDLLSRKKYSVVPDHFLYGNDSKKNAPDVIGLKTKSGKHIPFVKYDNGSWVSSSDMPRIEVKVVRKDQALVGVREAQMIDDFYIFIESDLKGDYLSTVFEEGMFSPKYLKKLKTNSDYIKRDESNQIIKHSTMSKSKKIGTMKLIGTYTRNELKKRTTLFKKKKSPYYFSGAQNVDRVIRPHTLGYLKVDKDGIVKYKGKSKRDLYLPFSIKNHNETTKKMKVIKKNKGSVYIESKKEPLEINGEKVEAGYIKISFKKFERSSSWNENIASKYMLEKYGTDTTRLLIRKFDEIYSKNK